MPTPIAPQQHPADPLGSLPHAGSNSAPRAIDLEQAQSEIITLKRRLRKVWVLIAGTIIIIAGIIISPLPGPGFIILGPVGLALIATEFVWARKLLIEVRARANIVQKQTDSLGKRTSPVWVIPVIVVYWLAAYLLAEQSPIPSAVVWALSFPLFTPIVLWGWATMRYRGVPVSSRGRAKPKKRRKMGVRRSDRGIA